jgi:hypothetical protein
MISVFPELGWINQPSHSRRGRLKNNEIAVAKQETAIEPKINTIAMSQSD